MAQIIEPIDSKVAALESGGNYNATNPQSTASGKYQFIQPTFEGVKKNNPDLPQISFDEFKKDPDAQEKYQIAYRQENERVLQKHGLEVTPVNQYVMHWAGAPKGTALLRAKDDEPLGNYLNKEVLVKNKLSGDKTIGEFKADINSKMDRALGAPAKLNEQARLDAVYQGQRALGQTALGPTATLAQNNQVKALDTHAEKIGSSVPNSPEQHQAIADALSDGAKKEYGPNWTNAVIAAALGQKQAAYTWITGGQNKEPILGEVMVGDQPKQVWINSNERGDKWFTDPDTGKRLNDNLTVTSLSPEGSLSRANAVARIKAGVPAGIITPISNPEAAAHETTATNITTRSNAIPAERSNVQRISTGNQRYGEAINNALRDKNNRAMIDIVNAVKAGKVDDALIAQAASSLKLPNSDYGSFGQFIKDMALANSLEASAKGTHAPGAGTAGELDLRQGTAGVAQWLSRKDNNLFMQGAYSDFYNQEKAKGKNVAQINKDWESSEQYKAIENRNKLQADKLSGRAPNLKDGDPIAVVVKGQLSIKRYNSKTGRGE